MQRQNEWTTIVRPKTGWWDINLRELWDYRDLIRIFVYRDFVVYYKQSILGPLWFILKPLFGTIVFTIIFSKVAKIPTDSLPPMLFYLAGTVMWNYFSSCLTFTSNTFVTNASIFGKVYFPRMVVPIGIIISQLVQFAIQFGLFLVFLAYFLLMGAPIHPNANMLLLPLLLLQMAALGLGVGMIVSSLVTKYRDLTFVMDFVVQLWMYATPVVYSISQVPGRWRFWYSLNPMVAVIELFRKGFLGVSSFTLNHYVVSFSATAVVLGLGIVIFSKVEKSFMDNV